MHSANSAHQISQLAGEARQRPCTILELLHQALLQSGKLALTDMAANQLDYPQLAQSAAAIAHEVGNAKRVGLCASRGVSGLLGFLGICTRAACAPMAPGAREEEYLRTIQALDLDLIVDFFPDHHLQKAAARANVTIKTLTLATLLPATLPAVESVDPSDVALLLQTSGTTSNPKTVALSHRQILAAMHGIVQTFSLNEADVCLNLMPMFHAHGLLSAGLATLVGGGMCVCAPNFNATEFFKWMNTYRPTWLTGAPTMHLALLEEARRNGCKQVENRLRFFRSSSAPLPMARIEELESLFAAPLLETYGLTETASMITSNLLPPLARKVGSVGIVVGAGIQIVDPLNQALPSGQIGEILLRGPSVIEAYENNPEANQSSFHDGWLKTGDAGWLDDDGYLFISHRIKEVIKRGGQQISPAEIDACLETHPAVFQAISFSVPHASMGEELVAAVILNKDMMVSENALRSYVMAQLSTYKVPSSIVVVPDFPRNATGKIVRRELGKSLLEYFSARGLAPVTELEKNLCSFWAQRLGVAVGVTDNLYLLGLDPISATKHAKALEENFQWHGASKALFMHPTVRQQCAHLAVGHSSSN